jgi:LysR family glycine cleavage system transcriptional activator
MNRPLPPLDALTAVREAARTGSFSAAAEALGVTHGSISRRVKAVEHWLGAALFERHGRGVRATPAGLRFSRQIERMLEDLAQSAEQWRPRKGAQSLKVSVLPSFAKLWLLERLSDLEGTPQDLRVELVIEHRLADLDGGEADVALRYGRGNWPGLSAARLFTETLIPVAAPRLADRLESADAQTITRLPLIHDSNTSGWRRWLAGEGAAYTPRDRDRKFEDYDLVLAAASAGLGVALLRSVVGRKWLNDGRVRQVSERRIDDLSSPFVVYRQAERRDAPLQFVQRLLDLAAGEHADEVARPSD